MNLDINEAIEKQWLISLLADLGHEPTSDFISELRVQVKRAVRGLRASRERIRQKLKEAERVAAEAIVEMANREQRQRERECETR